MKFLCDTEDTVEMYEARGEKRQYTHDAGLDALSSGLSRVQQVEMVHGKRPFHLLVWPLPPTPLQNSIT